MDYKKHTVSYGESLQSISQDILGDADRWVEIAILNNLVYPYIDDEGSAEGVKTIGDTLLVPQDANMEDIIPQNEVAGIYEKSLGQDLDIFGDEDYIELTNIETGEVDINMYGDLRVVFGLRNLRQSILIRLSTPIGTLLHHPEFGSSLIELLGTKGTVEKIHKVKVELERCIRSDERVADITFETFYLDGDLLRVGFTVTPVGFDVAFKMSLKLGEGGIVEWA